MKKLLLAVVLSGFSSIGVADADIEKCNELRNKFDHGLNGIITVEATQLFNANNVIKKDIHFKLNVDPSSECGKSVILGTITSVGFTISGKASIETEAGTWAASIGPGPKHFIDTAGTGAGFDDRETSLTVYHAVTAALLNNVGFEVFEGNSNTPFSELVKFGSRNLPFEQNIQNLIGITEKDGEMYQLSIAKLSLGYFN